MEVIESIQFPGIGTTMSGLGTASGPSAEATRGLKHRPVPLAPPTNIFILSDGKDGIAGARP